MSQDSKNKLVQGTIENKYRAPLGLAGTNHRKPIMLRPGETFEGQFYVTKRLAALIDAGKLAVSAEDVETGGDETAAVQAVTNPAPAAPGGATPSADVLKSVLPKLGAEDFTDDGKPKVEAVNKALPFGPRFTSEDRDAAWATLSAQ